jgi:hypothetical protein
MRSLRGRTLAEDQGLAREGTHAPHVRPSRCEHALDGPATDQTLAGGAWGCPRVAPAEGGQAPYRQRDTHHGARRGRVGQRCTPQRAIMQLAQRASTAAHRQVSAATCVAWRPALALGLVAPRQHARHGPGLVAARCTPKQAEDAGREGAHPAWEATGSMAPPHAGPSSGSSSSSGVSNGSSSSAPHTHAHTSNNNGSTPHLPLNNISVTPGASTQTPELGTSYSDFYKAHHNEREPLIMASRDASDEPPSTAAPSTSKASSSAGGKQDEQGGSSVADALSRAQAALDRVETSLEEIDSLPSAHPPVSTRLTFALSVARTVAAIGALCATLLASHAFGIIVQWLSAAVRVVSLALCRSLALCGRLARSVRLVSLAPCGSARTPCLPLSHTRTHTHTLPDSLPLFLSQPRRAARRSRRGGTARARCRLRALPLPLPWASQRWGARCGSARR